jgi:hypothetical protein
VRQASARGLGWQTMTADDFPLPSCAVLAEDIRADLEDGSGIVLLQGHDPSAYSLDELRLLYAAIARQVGTFVYSKVMREIRDVGRQAVRSVTARCRNRRVPSCRPTPAPSQTARCASTPTATPSLRCSASARRRGAA